MITFRQPFRGDYPITQKYGEVIPGVTYQNKPHTGIDYGCPDGTEILASADGVVKLADFDNTGYGYTIIIRHNDGRATLYAHLSLILCHINQTVKQGSLIAISGSTGYVTGAHLHFEARREWYNHNSHFDPMDLPLMSFADAAEPPESAKDKAEKLPSGVYKVACEYAYIRTWDGLARDRILTRGERVYIFDDVKYSDGLPFRFIGAGRCIAEYDIDGTKILDVPGK